MSTVIGIKKGKNVWIGSDSRGTTPDGYVRPGDCIKVFRNGPYLIGVIGTVRGGQILLPPFFEPPENVYDFPDALREQVRDKGCLTIDEDNCEAHQCNYLLGYEGNLFEVLSDFSLGPIDDYTAIGSGSHFAFGALYAATRRGVKDPVKRISLGLETAAHFDVSTAGPFNIIKL